MQATTAKAKAKPAASKKRSKPVSEDELSEPDKERFNDESLLSNTPPSAKKQKKAPAATKKTGGKPLQPIENETVGYDGTTDAPAKQATEQYQKVSVTGLTALIPN